MLLGTCVYSEVEAGLQRQDRGYHGYKSENVLC